MFIYSKDGEPLMQANFEKEIIKIHEYLIDMTIKRFLVSNLKHMGNDQIFMKIKRI
jgi:wyosine [tRNA(Phe)-imidazoG37] synthetase (radical SAM superfamily)